MIRFPLALSVLVAAGLVPAIAQEKPAAISPAKRALIEKALHLNGTAKAARSSLDMAILQAAMTSPQAVIRSLPELQKATPEQRKQIQASFQESVKRTTARGQAELPKHLDFDKTVMEIFVPIYDRHFNDADLKGLIAFHESPLGRKLAAAQPQLQSEAMKRANELFSPKVSAMMNPILAEERKKLAEETKKLLGK
jgi:hypothetical protein